MLLTHSHIFCNINQMRPLSSWTKQARQKPCAYGNFVKFGGWVALHHNKGMSTNTLSVVMSSSLMVITSLPFPDLDHETPLHTIGNAIGYVILRPWNLTSFSM